MADLDGLPRSRCLEVAHVSDTIPQLLPTLSTYPGHGEVEQ